MAKKTTISCLLCPLQQRYLLLPCAMVAEVIIKPTIDVLPAEAPSWLLGYCLWQQQNVPVISFESANNNSSITGAHSTFRLVILKACTNGHRSKHYALPIQDIPQVEAVNYGDLISLESEEGVYTLHSVQLHDKVAIIPDYGKLEHDLLSPLSMPLEVDSESC